MSQERKRKSNMKIIGFGIKYVFETSTFDTRP